MTLDRSMIALCAVLAALSLQACAEGEETRPQDDSLSSDPILARALSDPLMADPDLAYRNEANAALTMRYDHPLPPLVATDELSERASNAARVELLEGGPIAELPFPVSDTVADLADVSDARTMVERVGGPRDCASRLEEGLGWAARMPGPSQIMPHGMVQQAAGVEGAGCSLRVVRYVTPASFEDVLQYHFTLADRARLRPVIHEDKERAIVGDGRTQQLVVHMRPGPGGLAAVDLIYWGK